MAHFPLAFRKMWGPFNDLCISKGEKKSNCWCQNIDNDIVLGIGLLSLKCFLFEEMLPVSTGCRDSEAFQWYFFN